METITNGGTRDEAKGAITVVTVIMIGVIVADLALTLMGRTVELAEVTIRSNARPYSRTASIFAGPSTAHRAAVFLDGEYYLERVGALPLLESLTKSGRIAPMALVFLHSGGPEARHADYVCSSQFAEFVARDVLGWLREASPGLSAGQHLIAGLSLSGLAAVHISLTCPALFSAALSQSGSHWWEPETLTALVRGQRQVEGRFWLSVGDEETEADVSHPPTGLYQAVSQIEGVERAYNVLAKAGADAHLHRFRGGHDFPPWRAELGDALEWLLRE
jgi:enterochelin esterase family protein